MTFITVRIASPVLLTVHIAIIKPEKLSRSGRQPAPFQYCSCLLQLINGTKRRYKVVACQGVEAKPNVLHLHKAMQLSHAEERRSFIWGSGRQPERRVYWMMTRETGRGWEL
ncbi:hypothetical protein V6N13_120825 [Hibiscus sabdariffa]